MQPILENHLLKWLNAQGEYLPLIFILAMTVPVFRFIIEVLKSIEHFYPRRDSKIERKNNQLTLINSLKDPALSSIVTNSLKDDLFIANTGIYFSGKMRERFLELYPKFSDMIPLHGFKMIATYLYLKDGEIECRKKWKTNLEHIFFFMLVIPALVLVSGTGVFVALYAKNGTLGIGIFLYFSLIFFVVLIVRRLIIIKFLRIFRNEVRGKSTYKKNPPAGVLTALPTSPHFSLSMLRRIRRG